jgi:hypothetical protein
MTKTNRGNTDLEPRKESNMTTNTTLKRRAQRTAQLRRRATVAGVGVLLSAFALVGLTTTALPSDEPQPAHVPASTSVTNDSGQPAQGRASVAAPRRIKTRQS